ncbi:hypothetical protein [Thalassotalea sp. PLHSN55]|uniref:hypothetical protein n=1 Tax=Thalassotalea sp. PLHSN55 TaxID=3435888 RepID=UPI003F83CDD3
MKHKKPDRSTALLNIISAVRHDFPFNVPESNICGISCVGCPKKLLELVDTELCDWEVKIADGVIPNFGEISRLAKLCENVRRGLKRNNLVNLSSA